MSEGRKIPLVLFPRFTSLVGDDTFYTTPIDALGYSRCVLTFWHGAIRVSGGPTGDCVLSIEQSADLTQWELIDNPVDPGADTPTVLERRPSMRYIRGAMQVGGADPAVTLWVEGYADETVK